MEKLFTILILAFFTLNSLPVYSASFEEEKPLNIYPNPASDFLNIEFTSNELVKPEIKIIDLTGKMVKKFDEQVFREHEIYKAELDISDLKSGIYFVKVVQAEKVYTEKLIVS